jgi:uncharacterized protein (DUF736 family)
VSYEPKDNSGALFKNDKDGNEKRPDYRGNAVVNGQPMQISAWVKDGKKGKYLSLQFQTPRKAERPTAPDIEDELPPF